MAQLIDDILKLSRVTRSEMNIEKVNLTQIAWSIINELQKSQPERLINIKIAEGLEDTADPRLMRVALENLLGNAWKFTGKQSEAVIEFGSTKEGEKKVYFIRDNGAGFDMAYADKLFAPSSACTRWRNMTARGSAWLPYSVLPAATEVRSGRRGRWARAQRSISVFNNIGGIPC